MAKQKKETIQGVEYTFQKVPPREWARLRDRSKNRFGNMIEETFLSEIFKHIVVDPKTSLDDFEEWEEAQEVANAAIIFQLGRAAEE